MLEIQLRRDLPKIWNKEHFNEQRDLAVVGIPGDSYLTVTNTPKKLHGGVTDLVSVKTDKVGS